jgi:hypothetical protein
VNEYLQLIKLIVENTSAVAKNMAAAGVSLPENPTANAVYTAIVEFLQNTKKTEAERLRMASDFCAVEVNTEGEHAAQLAAFRNDIGIGAIVYAMGDRLLAAHHESTDSEKTPPADAVKTILPIISSEPTTTQKAKYFGAGLLFLLLLYVVYKSFSNPNYNA